MRDQSRLQRAERLLDHIRDQAAALPQDELSALPDILYFSAQHRLAAEHGIVLPVYNVALSYLDNVQLPWADLITGRPSPEPAKTWSLLGRSIGFPIGVPASALTANSFWLYFYARHGFNVLTYKTVRTRGHAGYEKPNWVLTPQADTPFPVETPFRRTIVADPDSWVPAGKGVSTVNSFGVPSSDPDEWKADIAEAQRLLRSDQCLIVSVVGDIYQDSERTRRALIEDYVQAALHAEEAGAELIELNLSCPNSLDISQRRMRDPVCFSVELTRDIVEAVRRRLDPDTKIIAKLAYLPKAKLAELIGSIGRYIDAVAGINTLQVSAITSSNDYTFPGRPQAGLSGRAIANYALEFVRNLSSLKVDLGYDYDIIGMGGVTNAESFKAMYDAGCTVVQSATGSFANPRLAVECVEAFGTALPFTAGMNDPGIKKKLTRSLLDLVEHAKGATDKYALAAEMPVAPSLTYAVLDQMEEAGLLKKRSSRRGHRFYEIGSSVV
ncbi:dihydroorotate oxidase [Nocardia gamkensis]|uniref:dihydroorotate oxidase n=1 Tax=Nocardia gamkensis TaxID=352869 RepID=UPI001471BD21|nr:dihydroorotate oxidase [Nocardia gamkensis]